MQGHRQAQTTIRVTEIAYGGEKATAPKTERKPKKQAEAGEAAPAKQAAAKGKKSAAKKSSSKKSAAKKSGSKKK
jgi:hypothetical protein